MSIQERGIGAVTRWMVFRAITLIAIGSLKIIAGVPVTRTRPILSTKGEIRYESR
jgi:hypothetical protein